MRQLRQKRNRLSALEELWNFRRLDYTVKTMYPETKLTATASTNSFPTDGNSSVDAMEPISDAKCVLLINIIMRHQQPQFAVAKQLLPNLKCLLSVETEPHRDYNADFSSLDVSIQKSWTIRKKWNHKSGFSDNLYVHFPYDTFGQLRRIKPQAIVSFELGFRSLCSALFRRASKRTTLTIVVNESEHTAASWGLARKMLRPFILRSADSVTYNGSSCKRYLESIGVPASKLLHMPYTAHPKMIFDGTTARPTDTRHRLLYVGQLTERKNPVEFTKVLNRWCKSNSQRVVDFSIVGRGPLLEELQREASAENLRLNVIGPVDPNDLPRVYAEHGIMVFPTLADEWGLVVNEAMHSGLATLSSIYAQATLDLIRDNENGWRFTADDEQSTLDGLNRALNSSVEEIDQMAELARRDIANRTPQWSGRLLANAAVSGLAKT